jgi:hypothetical protein
MSYTPFENNPYVSYSNSTNELFLDLINPFGYMYNFAVQIVSPLLPSFSEPLEEQPEYTLQHFLVWGRPFEQFLQDGVNSALYPMFYALTELAKVRIRWTLIGNEIIWKQLVSFYIAHYLEINLKILKDEANRLSMEAYDKDKDYKYTMEVGGQVFEDFKETQYGRMFWHIYKPYGQFDHWGVNY